MFSVRVFDFVGISNFVIRCPYKISLENYYQILHFLFHTGNGFYSKSPYFLLAYTFVFQFFIPSRYLPGSLVSCRPIVVKNSSHRLTMEAEDNIQKMYKYFGILADAKENIAEVSWKRSPAIIIYN